ncbi:MAG: DNA-binding protein [Candidatus Omnitrophica bacterium]|nr:DNA-binding protein [Candidatus Omnitrophota bacterium]MDD5653411.1 DNA-binding protein [Candidatus Omnitrophota bacterium]
MRIGFLIICALNFCVYGIAYAQPLNSNELINQAGRYDGKVITYAGEVVGDVMVRGNYAWINVKDSSNAIGIWVDKTKVQDIIYTGSYKSQGDWIEVSGVFHRACSEHGADLDIHGEVVKKIVPGRPISEEADREKRKIAVTLLGGLCLALILQFFKKPSKKKSSR